MRKRAILLAAVFGVAVLGASFNLWGQKASATVPGVNRIISVNAAGTGLAFWGAKGTNISANGRYVSFNSEGSNVVAGDTNGETDAFVRDTQTNTTTRVSVSDTGTEANDQGSASAISDTGRYVVFSSAATNLIGGVILPGTVQAYLRDTVANTTTLLSQTTAGVIANQAASGVAISEDGRFVLIASSATNLGTTVPLTNNTNLYMLDRSDGSFTLLNRKYDGTIPTSYNSLYASMSCDGSLVAFTYGAALTTNSSGHRDVYLLDRRAGNILTDITPTVNDDAASVNISCNGTYIGFGSYAYNIDSLTSNPSRRAYTYAFDRKNGTFSLIDKASSGAIANDINSCGCASISDRGIATFSSRASNLGVSNAGYFEVYIRDLSSGTTELLSRNSSGAVGNSDSNGPKISSNGSIVSYMTYANNINGGVGDFDVNAQAYTSLTGY